MEIVIIAVAMLAAYFLGALLSPFDSSLKKDETSDYAKSVTEALSISGPKTPVRHR